MNEIERFKKGRMIGKYLAGKPITIGGVTYTPEGNNYYYFTNNRGHRLKNTITAQEFEKIRLRTPTEETLGGYVREKNRSLFGSGYRWYDASKPNSAVAIDKEIEVGDWIIRPDGTKVHKSVRQQNINGGQPAATQNKGRRFIDRDGSEYWLGSDGSKTLLKKGILAASSTGGTPGATAQRRVGTDWNKQYQDFLGKMTDDQKAWLAQRGIDYSSAQQMQTYLANHGQDLGKWGADGRWGNTSQAAWDNFVATTMKNNPLQTPVKDQPKVAPVLDAPDPFGYKTSNTYEDDDFVDKLEGMGIRSNADLINFMHNSGKAGWKGDAWQTQFRKDVDRALGGDYSDANIQKVFNTKNGWGRGFLGKGDFTDFQNALQTNAGVWNGMYERKQNDARIDAARKQAAERMGKKYVELNSVQLKPISQEFINKYSIYAKPATSTLGTAGAGSMSKTVKPYDLVEEALKSGQYYPQPETGKEEFIPLDWMLQAAKAGYLPQQ